MNNFIKQNWFKMIIAIAILIVAASVGYYLVNNSFTSKKVVKSNDSLVSQQRCAAEATIFYNSKSVLTAVSSSYIAHYNQELDKCFIEITANEDTWTAKQLIDANEGKIYATITIFTVPDLRISCSTQTNGVPCNSEADFDKFVKPYMEN